MIKSKVGASLLFSFPSFFLHLDYFLHSWDLEKASMGEPKKREEEGSQLAVKQEPFCLSFGVSLFSLFDQDDEEVTSRL